MATMTNVRPYEARTWTLTGLDGLSDDQLKVHYALYQGYVTNSNKLLDETRRLVDEGKEATPEFAEMKRRFGFEFNGMRLHEYYFDNLKANGGKVPSGGKLAKALEENFGSVEAWEKDFMGVLKMRGIGWALLVQDPVTGRLINHWTTMHEEGNFAGFVPILVIDCWEHAFSVDYKPNERPKYVEAVWKNINWEAVEGRLR